MIRFLQAGLANNLEDAYSKAVWQNEDIRNKMIADKYNADMAKKNIGRTKS
jgi:hypothetical protein